MVPKVLLHIYVYIFLLLILLQMSPISLLRSAPPSPYPSPHPGLQHVVDWLCLRALHICALAKFSVFQSPPPFPSDITAQTDRSWISTCFSFYQLQKFSSRGMDPGKCFSHIHSFSYSYMFFPRYSSNFWPNYSNFYD